MSQDGCRGIEGDMKGVGRRRTLGGERWLGELVGGMGEDKGVARVTEIATSSVFKCGVGGSGRVLGEIVGVGQTVEAEVGTGGRGLVSFRKPASSSPPSTRDWRVIVKCSEEPFRLGDEQVEDEVSNDDRDSDSSEGAMSCSQ